jgi:hypothetical protein
LQINCPGSLEIYERKKKHFLLSQWEKWAASYFLLAGWRFSMRCVLLYLSRQGYNCRGLVQVRSHSCNSACVTSSWVKLSWLQIKVTSQNGLGFFCIWWQLLLMKDKPGGIVSEQNLLACFVFYESWEKQPMELTET